MTHPGLHISIWIRTGPYLWCSFYVKPALKNSGQYEHFFLSNRFLYKWPRTAYLLSITGTWSALFRTIIGASVLRGKNEGPYATAILSRLCALFMLTMTDKGAKNAHPCFWRKPALTWVQKFDVVKIRYLGFKSICLTIFLSSIN